MIGVFLLVGIWFMLNLFWEGLKLIDLVFFFLYGMFFVFLMWFLEYFVVICVLIIGMFLFISCLIWLVEISVVFCKVVGVLVVWVKLVSFRKIMVVVVLVRIWVNFIIFFGYVLLEMDMFVK